MRTRRETPQFEIHVRHSKNCPYRDDPTYPAAPASNTSAGTQRASSIPNPPTSISGRKPRIFGHEKSLSTAAPPSASRRSPTPSTPSYSPGGWRVEFRRTGKVPARIGAPARFLEGQGIHPTEDVTKMHLMAFRSTWEDLYESSTTRSKVQERLKAFFKDCADTYRLSHNPAKGLKAIKFNTPPTMPLSLDKEYPALLKATNEFRPPMCHRLHALVQLMRWSGLAFQDACCFERSNLRRDANGVSLVKIRRAKTGVDVEVAIPPEVSGRARSVAEL